MVQSLRLGPSGDTEEQQIRRLNKLPLVIVVALIMIFCAIVFAGLSWRGIRFDANPGVEEASDTPATSFGDRLKQGVFDGIIGEPERRQVLLPSVEEAEEREERKAAKTAPTPVENQQPLAPEEEWRTRLQREQEEQYKRERHRQVMARLQAQAVALDSPLTVDVSRLQQTAPSPRVAATRGTPPMAGTPFDFYERARETGLLQAGADANGQPDKETFFNQDIKDSGYLGAQVVPATSRYELKRGSVIPATLITGLNSDLPGRLMAQVSQDVYDSATGHHLLIPQGAKLFGRYDSKVSFGQERALVVWTDLIFPDGATLQVGGMAGTDAAGYGGFKDKVDRHYARTFGAAALVALIGAGIDMSIPQSSTLATQDTASDAARRNFAETFGRVAEQTISGNLNVQPTIRVRPGYRFNVLVDQDMVFPSDYHN